MEDWPLLLAGPIVRRVEPTLASVWVALKEPRAVRLSIFDAPVDTGPGDTVFGDPSPLMVGHARTLRVGENLHIAVVQAASQNPLLPGHIYAYNVAFGEHDVEPFVAKEDLRSLLLLRDHRPVQPPPGSGTTPVPFVPPYVALGYEMGLLPTFVMPPADLTELRIAHGSCRRPGARIPDLMASLDDQIEAARSKLNEAIERPQQFFLTGDQIYADDVAPALLQMCTLVGNELMGSIEQLPIMWKPPGTTPSLTLTPADLTHFPAGCRKPVIREDAAMSTDDGESHLLSLGEFCAMHLLVWNNALWGEHLPKFDDLFWRVPLPPSQFDEVEAGLALPPPIWELHTGLYEKSRFGLKDRCEDTEDLQTFTALNVSRVLKCVAQSESSKKSFDEQTEDKPPSELKTFRDLLPKVRRVLANVATYMMFDDHDVTDDWNLSQIWRDRVFTSPLGKTIVRNGLLGYFLCQGWGNDPAAFEEDVPQSSGPPQPSPRKQLMLAIPRLFQKGDELPPDRTASDEIDVLLGLDGADPPVKWHYSIDGPRHRAIVLDNRTRRAFESRVSPPTNLSANAIRDQIPNSAVTPLPAGVEVLFVIAPLPLLGVALFDELLGPLSYRAFDVKHFRTIAGLPGTNPDAIEGWSNVPRVFEEVLAKLAPYRRIVVLSGDVHYAYSTELSYWVQGDPLPPARFAQFTSSGLKNVWPADVIVLNRSFAFGEEIINLFSPLSRLGWLQNDPAPIQLPADTRIKPGIRDVLVRSPVLLPAIVWPKDTVLARQPDWAWRLTLSVDKRKRGDLPGGAKPAPLDPADPTADAPLSVEGYRQAARRHAQLLEKSTHTRRILFASNFGIVTFSRDAAGAITAKHDLFARPGGAGTAAAFTSHTIALDVPVEPMPTIEIETDEPAGGGT
jgi:hypothetical protein